MTTSSNGRRTLPTFAKNCGNVKFIIENEPKIRRGGGYPIPFNGPHA